MRKLVPDSESEDGRPLAFLQHKPMMKAAEKKQKRADQQVAILDKRGAQLQNAADKQVAILDKSGSLLNQMAKMRGAKLKKRKTMRS